MKAKVLIEALSKLDPETNVVIAIKQYNKTAARIINIEDTLDKASYQFWVGRNYGGSITVHLPDKAIISNWPKTSHPIS